MSTPSPHHSVRTHFELVLRTSGFDHSRDAGAFVAARGAHWAAEARRTLEKTAADNERMERRLRDTQPYVGQRSQLDASHHLHLQRHAAAAAAPLRSAFAAAYHAPHSGGAPRRTSSTSGAGSRPVSAYGSASHPYSVSASPIPAAAAAAHRSGSGSVPPSRAGSAAPQRPPVRPSSAFSTAPVAHGNGHAAAASPVGSFGAASPYARPARPQHPQPWPRAASASLRRNARGASARSSIRVDSEQQQQRRQQHDQQEEEYYSDDEGGEGEESLDLDQLRRSLEGDVESGAVPQRQRSRPMSAASVQPRPPSAPAARQSSASASVSRSHRSTYVPVAVPPSAHGATAASAMHQPHYAPQLQHYAQQSGSPALGIFMPPTPPPPRSHAQAQAHSHPHAAPRPPLYPQSPHHPLANTALPLHPHMHPAQIAAHHPAHHAHHAAAHPSQQQYQPSTSQPQHRSRPSESEAHVFFQQQRAAAGMHHHLQQQQQQQQQGQYPSTPGQLQLHMLDHPSQSHPLSPHSEARELALHAATPAPGPGPHAHVMSSIDETRSEQHAHAQAQHWGEYAPAEEKDNVAHAPRVAFPPSPTHPRSDPHDLAVYHLPSGGRTGSPAWHQPALAMEVFRNGAQRVSSRNAEFILHPPRSAAPAPAPAAAALVQAHARAFEQGPVWAGRPAPGVAALGHPAAAAAAAAESAFYAAQVRAGGLDGAPVYPGGATSPLSLSSRNAPNYAALNGHIRYAQTQQQQQQQRYDDGGHGSVMQSQSPHGSHVRPRTAQRHVRVSSDGPDASGAGATPHDATGFDGAGYGPLAPPAPVARATSQSQVLRENFFADAEEEAEAQANADDIASTAATGDSWQQQQQQQQQRHGHDGDAFDDHDSAALPPPPSGISVLPQAAAHMQSSAGRYAAARVF